ncbi:MAG: hypothetical protein QOH69_1010 [Actinomycetota bacterium]|jgi:hypothetical protein|nr:hypothetical protein [Actinomycetota bacterium]
MAPPAFKYTEHPRIAEREKEGVPTVRKTVKKIAAESPAKKFNSRLGLAITTTVGTMWAAYAFFLLTLVSLPAAIMSGSPIIIVSWIAQTFLQLVLLPIIIVGQNIQATASDARAAATYKDATAILAEAKQIQMHLAAQDAATSALLDKVAALEAALGKK